MRTSCYSGIGYNFQMQDLCITEGIGAIQDRTQEHLAPSDAPIVAARKLMLKAIDDVQAGLAEDPLVGVDGAVVGVVADRDAAGEVRRSGAVDGRAGCRHADRSRC